MNCAASKLDESMCGCPSCRLKREPPVRVQPAGSAVALPTVAGRRLRGSNADFERACLVHIERLQSGLGDYDSAMLDTFCEAVRLCREYSDAMAMPNIEVSDPATKTL